MINVIGVIFTFPPIFMSLWVIASIMTRQTDCSSCGKNLKVRHGHLIEVDLDNSRLDKYCCDPCLLKQAQSISEITYET